MTAPDSRTVDDRIALVQAAAHLTRVLDDPSTTPDTKAAIGVVMPVIDEWMQLTSFPDEWGVRFVDEDGNTDGPGEGDEYPTREPAERVVGHFVDARLVKRTSFRGAWEQVQG